MNKNDLLLPSMIQQIATSTNLTVEEMMKDGLTIVNDFRADPSNQFAIEEVFKNSTNSHFKISKFGEQYSMRLFLNNVVTLFQLQRDELYQKMPQDIGLKFHQEITKFYMTYVLAAWSALYLKQTTMSDVSVAVAEIREHFFEFLTEYIIYM